MRIETVADTEETSRLAPRSCGRLRVWCRAQRPHPRPPRAEVSELARFTGARDEDRV